MMKKIDELGISPWPWVYEHNILHSIKSFGQTISNAWVGCDTSPIMAVANAHLIAAAPELYECLSEAIAFIADNSEYIGADCDTKAFVVKCRAALAKAAGEEVANG